MTDDPTHHPPATTPCSPHRRLWLGAGLLAACCALSLLLAVGEWEHVASWLEAARSWLASKGHAGILVYGVVFTVCGLLALPVAPWTVIGALVYGPLLGFFVIHVSATLAAACAFLLARRWLRPALRASLGSWQRRLTSNSRFEAMRLVLLLRMSPVVPFAVLNYAAGLSRMRVLDFLLASAIGKVPNVALYAYSVAAARRLWMAPPNDDSTVVFWLGLVATALAVWQLSRVASRNLSARRLANSSTSGRSRG